MKCLNHVIWLHTKLICWVYMVDILKIILLNGKMIIGVHDFRWNYMQKDLFEKERNTIFWIEWRFHQYAPQIEDNY